MNRIKNAFEQILTSRKTNIARRVFAAFLAVIIMSTMVIPNSSMGEILISGPGDYVQAKTHDEADVGLGDGYGDHTGAVEDPAPQEPNGNGAVEGEASAMPEEPPVFTMAEAEADGILFRLTFPEGTHIPGNAVLTVKGLDKELENYTLCRDLAEKEVSSHKNNWSFWDAGIYELALTLPDGTMVQPDTLARMEIVFKKDVWGDLNSDSVDLVYYLQKLPAELTSVSGDEMTSGQHSFDMTMQTVTCPVCEKGVIGEDTAISFGMDMIFGIGILFGEEKILPQESTQEELAGDVVPDQTGTGNPFESLQEEGGLDIPEAGVPGQEEAGINVDVQPEQTEGESHTDAQPEELGAEGAENTVSGQEEDLSDTQKPENPIEGTVDETESLVGDNTAEHAGDVAGGDTAEQTNDEIGSDATEQTGDVAGDDTAEQTGDVIGDNTAGQTGDEIGDSTDDDTADKDGEEIQGDTNAQGDDANPEDELTGGSGNTAETSETEEQKTEEEGSEGKKTEEETKITEGTGKTEGTENTETTEGTENTETTETDSEDKESEETDSGKTGEQSAEEGFELTSGDEEGKASEDASDKSSEDGSEIDSEENSEKDSEGASSDGEKPASDGPKETIYYRTALPGNSEISLKKLITRLYLDVDEESAIVESEGSSLEAVKTDEGWVIKVHEPVRENGELLIPTLTVTSGNKIQSIEIEITTVPQVEGEGVVIASADGTWLPADAKAECSWLPVEEGIRVGEEALEAPVLEEQENRVVRYAAFDITTTNIGEASPEGEALKSLIAATGSPDQSSEAEEEENYPEGFRVQVELPENLKDYSFRLYHVNEETAEETEDVKNEEGILSFAAPGFGLFVLQYEADFSWGEYLYSFEGPESFLLGDLLGKLGIEEIHVEDIEDVTISNAELLTIEKTGADWTLGTLRAFNTHEPLTLTLRGGCSVTIELTWSYPAQSFTGSTAGVIVTAEAPEGAFPNGVTMAVKRVWDPEAISEISDAVSDDFVEVKRVQAVDIKFYDWNGEEIEPLTAISVSMSVSGMTDEQEATVVHVDKEGTVDVQASEVENSSSDGMAVTFDAENFSVYAIVITNTIETRYIDAAGNTYAVEVGYGPEANIPSGAELAVSELTGDEAADYTAQAAEALQVSSKQVTYAKALDITILADGEPVRPEAPVSVSVKLLDAPKALENTNIDVIHFGTEPEQVECALQGDVVEFEADGFSVYVLIVRNTGSEEEEYEYRINEDESVLLSQVLDDLKIAHGTGTLSVRDVKSLSAASPALTIETVTDEADPSSVTDWELAPVSAFASVALTLTLSDESSVVVNLKALIPLTIKADDKTKVYDNDASSDPELTATVTGALESDTINYSLGREEGQNAETYDITVTPGEIPDYYSVTVENGTFTIEAKQVTVKADDKSKTYDNNAETDPELTATVEGVVEGDTINYTLGREEGQNVGDYTITASGESEQGNYVVTYQNAVFSINKAILVITAASESKVYDGYELSNSDYTPDGLVDGDRVQSIVVEGGQTDVNVSDDPEVVTPPNNMVRDAQIVNAKGEDVNDNYDIRYEPGTLKVTKKPITITADSAEKVYDGTELKTDGFTSTGLADGDVFDGLTVTGSQTLVGESSNIPSEVQIVRPIESGIVDVNDNYSIDYANGTLKITKRELTITADGASKVYDGTPLTKETYTVEGLAEGDSVQTVTVTGSQTDAGKSMNKASEAKIVNSADEDVTGNYDIDYTDGELEVLKKSVRLTAVSGLKVYDGDEKTVNGYTVSAAGKTLDGVTFADTVTASGSGTEIGSYPVTFSGVTVDETDDTTGNYVVTETEEGKLQIVATIPLEKSLTFNGNLAEYTITINPDKLPLNSGNDLTLRDTITNNQSIDYSTVIPSDERVTYDYSGFTGTFTIPDEETVTITYKTRVSGTAGTEVTFGNTAELGMMNNGSFTPWYSKTVSETGTITPSGTDIDGTDGDYYIRLFTYVQNHMEEGLGGAVFRLLDANQRPVSYRAGEHAGEIVTFITGDNGYVDVALDDGIISLHKNTIYYLEMITAPVSDNPGEGRTYYKKDNTLYRFLITDDPSYSGNYNYFNGDVLKVHCYPEAAGVNVTKRFSGNYSLTDEQKNQIRFVLQKEDLATGGWIDVESHTYAEFSYGSMNFSTGSEGGTPLEQAVLYRVIEENAAVEGADCSSSVTLSYQRDDKTIQENTNEFEVNPDYSTFSFSLVFDNTYVEHKLTIVKLNELTGVLLTGAEFTVYKALDNTPVKTYVTEGEGVIEIRADDEGANYTPDTAYYVVETDPPEGYLTPKNPEKIYFYFSEASTNVPEGVPSGTTAVNLTTSYDAVVIANHTVTVNVPVTVTWMVDGSREWPSDVESVTVSLYRSVNDEEPVAVEKDGRPMTITLNRDKTFDNTTFVDLPARDESDNDITYSVRQQELPDYYTSYKVSGTGWYVVRNESAVSVTVAKEWYDLNGNQVDDASGMPSVTFDLYRTTEDHPDVTSREDLEALLLVEKPVKTGLKLEAPEWSNILTS